MRCSSVSLASLHVPASHSIPARLSYLLMTSTVTQNLSCYPCGKCVCVCVLGGGWRLGSKHVAWYCGGGGGA